MIKLTFKFVLITAIVVTSYITFTLVAVNVGFVQNFLFIWLRSWLIAFLLAVPSLMFVVPYVKSKLEK
jgi:hypothetical protein